MIGQTISHYRILEKLGEGGMGVVYKAHDAKLDRLVALKFLPSHLSSSPQDKARLLQEARVAATLDHPNVCTVYEVDETPEGQLFIAMAYYDGVTLRQKIESGPLTSNESIDISLQIADALRAAHEKGVVHRDVKSGNIMLAGSGQPKVMDFGLAKFSGSAKLSKEGAIIGTSAYMSPEQTRGEGVDHRSDIWSLGVVMYEVLTGVLPFGDFEYALVYYILNEDPPPVSSVRSGIPLEFERIIDKCLEKSPADRYQTITELLVDLRRLKRGKDSSGKRTRTSFASSGGMFLQIRRSILPISLTWVIVLAIIGTYYLVIRRDPKTSEQLLGSQKLESKDTATSGAGKLSSIPEMKLSEFVGGVGIADFPSWSPDGKWIAYASSDLGHLDIWKKPIDGGRSVQLTKFHSNERQPAWSPNGLTIAFSSPALNGGGIFLIPSEGGNVHRLTSIGEYPTWSPDGSSLAFSWNGNILLKMLSGGPPRLLVKGTSGDPYMSWSPDGSKIILWHRTRGDVYLFSLADSTMKAMNLVHSGGEEISGLSWSRDGRMLVFSRGPFGGIKNLWKLSLDAKSGQADGVPVRLSVSTTDDIHCSLSPDGNRIAYTVRNVERHLWSLPVDSRTSITTGRGIQLTSKGSQNYYPSLSRSGQMLVWTSHESGLGHLFLGNLKEMQPTKLTQDWSRSTRETGANFSPDGNVIAYATTLSGDFQIWRIPTFGGVGLPITEARRPQQDVHPAWSPDGENLAFYSNRSGNFDIWSIQAANKNTLKRLTTMQSNEMYPAWSTDGHFIAFRSDSSGSADIWLMTSDGGDPHPYVVDPAEEAWSAWSLDGRLFYFTSNRSGFFNVWVQSFKGGSPRQVTFYESLAFGLPEEALYTKFTVSSSRLILPLESRRTNLYLLENVR